MIFNLLKIYLVKKFGDESVDDDDLLLEPTVH